VLTEIYGRFTINRVHVSPPLHFSTSCFAVKDLNGFERGSRLMYGSVNRDLREAKLCIKADGLSEPHPSFRSVCAGTVLLV